MAAQMLIVGALSVGLAMGRQPVHKPPDLPPFLDMSTCPPSYQEEHPLILISMDGFRAEYLTRGLTPTIEAMSKLGVRAPFMKPSFPTITFPNHYTIVTGMYPPSHGIVANKFYDPEFKAEFRVGRPTSFEKRFWGGEPIWMTVKRQGKKSATMFWPGSEVNGNRGDYWFPYNESAPFPDRVNRVISWLELPPEERPSFISLYMHEPDSTGHDFGPYSRQLENSLVHVDSILKMLVEELQARQLLPCVNLLILADHGMAAAGDEKSIFLNHYIPNLKSRSRFWKGAFVRIQPNDESEAAKQEMLNALSCRRPEMRVYEKTTLPIRWHMGAQRRVEDIIVDVDAGYSVGGDDNFKADEGEHGYDNFFAVMNALFLGYGPAFRQNLEVESFQNIELYNLMCHLLDIEPAPNNGTWGALHHVLAKPPPSPPHPGFESPPPVRSLLLDEEIEDIQLGEECPGDSLDQDDWVSIVSDSLQNLPQVIANHLPWGVPSMGQLRDAAVTLPHSEAVTAYSRQLRLPLWTSFTITGEREGSEPEPWRSDARLHPSERESCRFYDLLLSYNITRQPLFPPQFSRGEGYAQLPYLMSNAVPITPELSYRWNQLLQMVKSWSGWAGPINVVTGPVFDYDSDTFVDDIESLNEHEGLKVPTHLFMVVSRCLIWTSHLSDCPHTHVDTLAFVYPQSLAVPNCLSAGRYAQEFMAKVQDVEKITGFRFFTNMRYDDQVKMATRIHSNTWGKESWWNRLRSNFFDIGRK